MTSTEQRSSKDLVQRLRRLSGGAKVVAGLAADEIERLQRQVDTLSRELAKFVTAHQQKADRLASEPRTAQPVAYRVEFEDGAVELWDGSAIPYEPLFGAEVTPLYAHAPPPPANHRNFARADADEIERLQRVTEDLERGCIALALKGGLASATGAGVELSADLYALLVKRGYAQHEAHAIAYGDKLAVLSEPPLPVHADGKFLRAWLRRDRLPGGMMESNSGKYGPVGGTDYSVAVTTSETVVQEWFEKGVPFLEVRLSPTKADAPAPCPDGEHEWLPFSNAAAPVQERMCVKCKKQERTAGETSGDRDA